MATFVLLNPIQLATPGYPLKLLRPNHEVSDSTPTLVEAIRSQGGYLLSLADPAVAAASAAAGRAQLRGEDDLELMQFLLAGLAGSSLGLPGVTYSSSFAVDPGVRLSRGDTTNRPIVATLSPGLVEGEAHDFVISKGARNLTIADANGNATILNSQIGEMVSSWTLTGLGASASISWAEDLGIWT